MIRVAIVLASVLAAAPEPPAGQRVKLTDGQLFVPADFRPAADGPELIVHLHGGSAAEASLAKSNHPNAVLVTLAIPGLSSVYTERFKSPATFARILDEAAAKLKDLGVTPARAKWKRVIVSSFSAGYGGVREMLKDPATFERVDGLTMCDSIYAGYADPARHTVEPKNMEGFLKFAEAAAAGKKWFVLSHCRLQPDGYASTGETADYLIAKLGGQREKASEPWPADGLTLEDRFRIGHFEVYGFAGTTGADHMRHLHGAWVLWRRIG